MSVRRARTKATAWGAVAAASLLWAVGPALTAPGELSALPPPPAAGPAEPRPAPQGTPGERRHMTVADQAVFISKVFVTHGDARCGGADTIEVHGENFLRPEEVFVGLGNRGPLALCRAATARLILGKLPPELVPGSFILSVSKGTAQSDFDVFDLTIGPRSETGSRAGGPQAAWRSADYRVAAFRDSRRILRCPADYPQVLTGGFRIIDPRSGDRAQVSRPVRGERPQPDGWEVAVDPAWQAAGNRRDLRYGIDIVCSR